jgi:hypothetical protein
VVFIAQTPSQSGIMVGTSGLISRCGMGAGKTGP